MKISTDELFKCQTWNNLSHYLIQNTKPSNNDRSFALGLMTHRTVHEQMYADCKYFLTFLIKIGFILAEGLHLYITCE